MTGARPPSYYPPPIPPRMHKQLWFVYPLLIAVIMTLGLLLWSLVPGAVAAASASPVVIAAWRIDAVRIRERNDRAADLYVRRTAAWHDYMAGNYATPAAALAAHGVPSDRSRRTPDSAIRFAPIRGCAD